MANNNVQDFGQAVAEVNAILNSHATALEKSATSLGKYNAQLKVLPSEYLTMQKEVNTQSKEQKQNIDNLKTSTDKLNTSYKQKIALTQQEKTDLQIINVEKRREAVLNSQVAGEYRKLSTAVAIASDKYQNLLVRGRLASQSQREFNKELRTAQKEFQTLQNKVLSADKAVDKWSRTGERTISLGRDLMGAFGIVGGVTLFAMLTKDIFEQTKEIQSLNKALQLVTETQENFYAQQVFLADISERYGVELNGLTKQFTQFYVSAKDKLAGREIQNIFESITKAGASMGLSVQSQERAFLALNQMMSKGTIQAEELRGQLGEALPGAFGIMAKAVGVTEKELAKMMKDGELLANELLPKFAKQLEITYGIENVNRIENLAGAQSRLTNAWRNFVASLDEDGNKLSKFFTNVLNEATSTINAWREIFTSASTLRKNELKSLRASGEELAKTNLKNISDSEDKAKYAIDMIISLQKEKRELLDEANKLQTSIKNIKTSTDPNINDVGGRGLRGYWEKEVNKQQQALGKLNNKISQTQGLINGYSTALEKKKPIVKAETELTKEKIKAIEEQKRIEEERFKQIYTNRKKELELELYVIEQSKDNEYLNINDRLTALEFYRNKKNEILLLDYNEEMRLAKGNHLKQEEALLDFHSRTLKEIESYNKDKEKIESLRLQPAGVVKLSNPTDELSKSTQQAVKDFEKLVEAQNKAKENLKEYNLIVNDFLKQFSEGFFSDAGLPTLFKVLNDEIVGFGENFAVTFNAIAEITQEALSFMTEATNNYFQNKYDSLAREKEIAISFAGDSASAREEIERQSEEKRKAIARREFQAKKKQTLFNIAIDTAQAIMATLARTPLPAGLPLVIATGALGALQAGVVASQQMPEFWTGVENSTYEGWATKDERGAELHFDKNGKIKDFGQNKGAKYTYVEKGDTILDHKKSMDFLMFNNELNSLLTNNSIDKAPNINIESSKIDLTPVINAINNKESVNLNIGKKGLDMYVRNGHTTKEITNRRINAKGQTF